MEAFAKAVALVGGVGSALFYIRLEWLAWNTARNVNTQTVLGWVVVVSLLFHIANPSRLNRRGRFWRKRLLSEGVLFALLMFITGSAAWYVFQHGSLL